MVKLLRFGSPGMWFVIFYVKGVLCNIDRLELIMPRYALIGGEVVLNCDHSVPLEHLHKVEYKRGYDKVLLYVKGRNPACRIWKVRGATLADQYCNATHVRLENVTFGAAGSYHCVVSMETPSIFTKESDSKELTIIDPQKQDPIISFKKSNYVIGEKLEANCTTSPSRPSPYITWLINDEKASDSLTRSYSNGLLHAHGYYETKAHSIKQLSIEVSQLHGGEDGKLRLTCVATIPGYVNKERQYADIRNATATIEIEEAPVLPSPVEAASSATKLGLQVALLLLLLMMPWP